MFGPNLLFLPLQPELPAPVSSWVRAGMSGSPAIVGPPQAVTAITFQNLDASSSPFRLFPGLYGMTAAASWNSGSVTLQILAADQLTWLTALTAFSSNGFVTASLPSGIFRVAVSGGATAVYVALQYAI